MMFLKRLYWTAHLAWHLRGQARYPFKPLGAIRRDQSRRVRRMVAYAYRHVPYYRETMRRLGLTPADFRSADDLAKLPITEREALQREPERFVSSAVALERCRQFRSSGSTGKPVEAYVDFRSMLLAAAHGERLRSIIATLVGRRRGYRETLILSPGSSPGFLRQFWRDNTLIPDRIAVHRQHLSLYDPLEENLARLREFQPDVIATSGSYLEVLFPHLHATGQPFPSPKVALYGSDRLSPAVRRLITDEFGAQVVSAYQAIEASRLAFECEQHSGLHVNTDLYPVRIVDEAGHDLPAGETGEVVIANLVNRATVLLNYRLNDLAAFAPEPCPCGRSLPLLSFPQGRSDHLVRLPSGDAVPSFIFYGPLDSEMHVWQWQVVQEAPLRFRILLVADGACDRGQLRERLIGKIARAIGQEATVEVRFVDAIERTAGGKHRTVVSGIRSPEAAADGEAQNDASRSKGCS